MNSSVLFVWSYGSETLKTNKARHGIKWNNLESIGFFVFKDCRDVVDNKVFPSVLLGWKNCSPQALEIDILFLKLLTCLLKDVRKN